jgi:Spy/CpxP family protein refolding chaperone
MKINKLSMAMMAAASLLAASPAVYAQTNSTGGGAAPAAPGRAPRMTVDQRLEALNKELTLTDEQKPKVKAALEEQNTAMTAARNADATERQTKAKAARDEFTKKMKEVLTPEQYKKFEAMPQPGRRNGAGGGANGGGAGAGGGANP